MANILGECLALRRQVYTLTLTPSTISTLLRQQHWHNLHVVTRAAARAAPNTKKIWLIPEAVPLAINIAGVGCLLLGATAYISSREPFFFLDKDKRRYGDAVYSQYPMPAPKPMSRNQERST
jgi:hypothetical protein